MKQSIHFLAFVAFLLILSCNQPKVSDQASTGTTEADVSEQCYKAVFEKDTADMKLMTDDRGKVTGTLVMSYGELKPNQVEKTVNTGNLLGSYRGDTLFVNYTFTTGKISETQYVNPLAFLRKGDTLVMGVGVIETSMGRSYFVKDKPINFEKGRFRFEPSECE